MAYPTGTDLSTFLIAAGVITAAPSDLTIYNDAMLGAVSAFEHDTNCIPFFNGGTAGTKYFDPDGTDTFWIPNTCLASDADDITVTLAGNILTLDEDYWLYPDDGPPFTKIVFGGAVGGNRKDLEILSVFGVQTTISGDVTYALLCKGATNAASSSSGGVFGKVKQGPVELDSSSGESQFLKDCKSAYSSAVSRYYRPTL